MYNARLESPGERAFVTALKPFGKIKTFPVTQDEEESGHSLLFPPEDHLHFSLASHKL